MTRVRVNGPLPPLEPLEQAGARAAEHRETELE
ncbi:hypothetical protein Mterra_00239 [Calidithermus terrae]|uniref:Uncharacterized protein n=1 Tax=Calidithermus terrae TaxID=1408545 RepID=A0A399F5U2_9DEIN|nr:hypothetical protein Mterra_00239 [Calidithermus terrae]